MYVCMYVCMYLRKNLDLVINRMSFIRQKFVEILELFFKGHWHSTVCHQSLVTDIKVFDETC